MPRSSAVPNFDSAASLLHLSRGLAPYDKTKKSSRKNASTLPGALSCLIARLTAITYIMTIRVFLCITDSMFLSVSTILRVFLSQ